MKIKISKIKALFYSDNGVYVKECDIYISESKIISIDKEPKNFYADKIIDGNKKLALPGLINAHTHSYMSVFRNIADDLSFEDWLFGRINPLEDKLEQEDMYWGAMLACIEMIRTGTTCFVDMNMNMQAVMRAVTDSGMRAVLSRGLVGEGDNEGGRIRLEENISAYKGCQNDNITFLLGPHAPYTCDFEYLKIVANTAKKYNLGITIHLSESKNEVDNIKKQYGMSPIELANETGLFDVPVIAAHCVWLSDNDLKLLADKNVSVASNPKSNLKLANGIAPLVKMQNYGINITIGTDSAASNNSLNMFSEMNYAALLHKGTSHNPTVISAADTIKFATKNAAKAIGNDRLGEIKEGMIADISILDIDCPQFYPENNLVSALVYSASGYETDTVIVNGRVLMENKIITSVDAERVYFECEKLIERIDK
ncbi:MAG: amidohydrolase [Clostridia bacterium]|nr:amidohydrolase [Clostridia bacterium]